jgi:hypothetical protein
VTFASIKLHWPTVSVSASVNVECECVSHLGHSFLVRCDSTSWFGNRRMQHGLSATIAQIKWPYMAIKKKYPLVNWHNYGKSPFLMGKSTINGPFSIAMFLFTGGYSIPWYSHSKTNPFYYGWLWLLRNGSLDNSFRRFIIFCEPVYHRFSVEKTGKPLLLKWSLKQNFELIIGNLNYHNWYSKTTLTKKERTNNKIWGSLLVFPQPSCRFLKEVQRPWPFEGWNTSEVKRTSCDLEKGDFYIRNWLS